MTTLVAPARGPAPPDASPSRSIATTARLLAHVVALAVVLLCLVPLLDNGAPASTDEGATLGQLHVLDTRGTWSTVHPAADLDPTGRWFPMPNSDRDGARWFPLPKHPAWIEVLRPAYDLWGERGTVLVQLLGAVVAALAGALLTRRIAPGHEVLALWCVGIGTPLLADGYVVMGHAVGAALSGLAALAAVGLVGVEGRPSSHVVARLVAVAGLSAALVLLRNEGVLFAVAVAVALVVAAIRDRRAAPFVGALAAVGGGAMAYVGSAAWAHAIEGDAAALFRIKDSVPWLRGRLSAFATSVLQPNQPGFRGLVPLAGVLVGLVLVVVATVRLRRDATDRRGWLFVALAAATELVAVVAGAPAVSGLIPAAPVVVLGLGQLGGADLRSRGAQLLVWIIAVDVALVLATQYADGGGLQWGGRYLHLALPVAAPFVALGVGRILDRSRRGSSVLPRVAVGALVVATGAVALGSVHRLRTTNADVAASAESAVRRDTENGHPPVLVFDQDVLGRLGWRYLLDQRALHAPQEDWPAVSARLGDTGERRVVVATAAKPSVVALAFPDYRIAEVRINASRTLRLMFLVRR
jgi:hypothetical protein